jgi:UDP-2,3-diacylglucosamine pyrophosphatase LpxH
MEYKRILVISDLHMTSGKNPLTKVWAATEDFFWDNDFSRFIKYYQDDSPSLLIINGDLFDFMQVLIFPDEEEQKEYSIDKNEINLKYGLRTSESASVFQIDKIFEGHIEFFKALASFLSKGNYVKILKGNHDIQLFWPKVQEQIIKNLEGLVNSDKKSFVHSNLEFLPWFFLIPDKIFVEHGNQYEYTTSFRNFLYPYLPFDYEDAGRQIELDLSSFLVRYFSNKMEAINPLADNIRPLSKYLGEFWKNYPFIFITSLGTALRYLLKAFNKAKSLSKMKKKSSIEDEKNKELIKLE